VALVRTIGEHSPSIDPGARLAPNAVVAGQVDLGPDVSVWYHAVLRSEEDRIEVGARTNIQDAVVIHTDEGAPALIGHDVQIGHAAVLHGCTVEPGVLIGMSATLLNGSRVRSGSVVAAGSVVLPTCDAPEGWLIAGVPARPVRPVNEVEQHWLATGCEAYVRRAAAHGFEAR
jgi:carbonic anhydrase/acetyltransferase-like protein (isoleucine patch superfamily)